LTARPGEYRVPDDTNVLELLSKAGGGSQLAQLSEVTITRMNPSTEVAGSTHTAPVKAPRVFRVNIEHILEGKTADIPMLQPGDVVMVPRNSWSAWRTTAAVLRDLSIVATTYFLAVRTYED
jgi:protein involved in polysaccharide export with SLBB domain